MRSRVTCDIDLDKKGKKFGHIRMPYQRNISAHGGIWTPICTIKNGEGPTVLLTGGVHGDEYEGQIALRKLVHSVRSEQISGCLIIIPSVNIGATMTATRLSSYDNLNLHGAFPGDANSMYPTQDLALTTE
ncbi:MAG: succinylglutamate desuccinylase/aspartoacylase family protein [Alphaproteobacteria bacterium]|jgi:N-alpha-acetyl-L-2,4-diaminobutyrate deacetylase